MDQTWTGRIPEDRRDPSMEVGACLFDAVQLLPALTDPLETEFRGEVQDEGKLGHQPAGGRPVGFLEQRHIESTPATLIGFGRELEPVRQDRAASREGWPDYPGDQLGASRQEEEQLARWLD